MHKTAEKPLRSQGHDQCWACAGTSLERPHSQLGNKVSRPGSGRALPDFKAHLRQNVCCGDNKLAWGMATVTPYPKPTAEGTCWVTRPCL